MDSKIYSLETNEYEKGLMASEYLQVEEDLVNKDDHIVTFFQESKSLDEVLMFVSLRADVTSIVINYLQNHELDTELVEEYRESGDFDKSYVKIIDYVSDRMTFNDNFSSPLYSMDLVRHIEQTVDIYQQFADEFQPEDKNVGKNVYCKQCQALIQGPSAKSRSGDVPFCSIKCADIWNTAIAPDVHKGEAGVAKSSGSKSNLYNIPEWVTDLDELSEAWKLSSYEFNALKAVFDASLERRGLGAKSNLYSIPEWVTDLDELSEAWNLSSYEFNALKAIFGASLERQRLGARHKAGEDEPSRDYFKLIHYSNKMKEAFNRRCNG